MDIRKCIIPRDSNGILVIFDFSQLEIFALAEITNDPVLIDELNRGVDIHRSNAAIWLKKDMSEVTEDERKQAKVMTFQLQYGAGSNKMAQTLGITPKAARDFINNFYRKYHEIFQWHDELRSLRDASEKERDPKIILSLLGRSPVCRAYTITRKENPDKSGTYIPLTEMKNYPVQGFATGDLVPLVVNSIEQYIANQYLETYESADLPAGHIVLCNTVHDDFWYDLTSAEDLYILLEIVEYVFTNLKEIFYNKFKYKLKLNYTYDAKIGTNASEMTKVSRKTIQELIEENRRAA